MREEKQPIGYWIKKADLLLTEGINSIHARLGITRTAWQVLNTIAQNAGISKTKLIETITPFSDEGSTIQIIAALQDKNWISETDTYTLTEAGKQVHADCMKRQQEFRIKAMNNISEEEYKITMKTLIQLVKNLLDT